jgi:hypothetical protein
VDNPIARDTSELKNQAPSPRLVPMPDPGEPWRVSSAPITVHRFLASGGRRVTAHRHGQDVSLGVAYSDRDLIVFLEAAGILDPETVIDDPAWVEWQGEAAHEWNTA